MLKHGPIALNIRPILFLCLLALLSACGQKGALMSPSEVAQMRAEAEKLKAAAEQKAPVENKEQQQ